MRYLGIGERIILTLWVGGVWAIGFLAVPVLFHTLNDRTLAGEVAAPMFTIINAVGLVCGVLLLIGAAMGQGRAWYRSWRVGVIIAMLVGTAVILFVIQPQMAALKTQVAAGGALGPRFGRLHGISSAIYLLVSVLGLLLVGGAGRRHGEQAS
jgi:Domain of unknown function (DUF4149)